MERAASKNNVYLENTSAEEIMITLGCVLVMSCNKVPAMHMYWLTKKSLGNSAVSNGIARNSKNFCQALFC